MKKTHVARRLVAAAASVALALGIFAAAPLAAEAKTNYRITKTAPSLQADDDAVVSLVVNGL